MCHFTMKGILEIYDLEKNDLVESFENIKSFKVKKEYKWLIFLTKTNEMEIWDFEK